MKCNVLNPKTLKRLPTVLGQQPHWLRGVDLNHRPLGYEQKDSEFQQLTRRGVAPKILVRNVQKALLDS